MNGRLDEQTAVKLVNKWQEVLKSVKTQLLPAELILSILELFFFVFQVIHIVNLILFFSCNSTKVAYLDNIIFQWFCVYISANLHQNFLPMGPHFEKCKIAL